MQRTAALLAGCFLGIVTGPFLPLDRVASAFAPHAVVWDGSNCSPGIYTVTSTARRVGGRESYQSASMTLELPRREVVQQFPNLPPGEYDVTATVRPLHGRAFTSDAQRITSLGDQPGLGGLRRRPPSAEVNGSAQPRRPATPPSPPPRVQTSASPGAAGIGVVAGSPNAARLEVRPGALDRILARLSHLRDPAGGDADWSRVDLIDADADGAIDQVRIEWPSGEVQVWRVTLR